MNRGRLFTVDIFCIFRLSDDFQYREPAEIRFLKFIDVKAL